MVATQVRNELPSIAAANHGASLWVNATIHASDLSDRLRQAWCGLGGHAMMLHFEPRRLSLQCVSCGHTTPGWSIDGQN